MCKLGFRVLENFADRQPIFPRQMRELRPLIPPIKHVMQPTVDVLLSRQWKRIATIRVNQITEWVAKHPAIELEVSQRTAISVARPCFREVRRIARRTDDPAW